MTMLDNSVPVQTRKSRHTATPRRFSFAAAAAVSLLAAAIWLSSHLRPSPALHEAALFVHLCSLILGFGAVLVGDYFFTLWALRRTTFAEAISSASRLHLLVWSGLVGLVLSGTLLEPDLRSGATLLKLAFVAVLTVNGLQATILSKRMESIGGTPPIQLLAWGAATTAMSQICWWGAVVIGFLNAAK
jgi:hypothetical protein